MNVRRIFGLIVPALLLLGCQGGEDKGKTTPSGGESGAQTTLAQLLEKAGSSTSDFDIQIKNLVVTAVHESYAQLEDGTCGAQLNKSGHGLAVGQTINGRITGKARNMSGALTLSALNTGSAQISKAASLPCTTVSLSEVLADKGKYTNRRVKLENVTFVNGFDGSANGSGAFSQKGVQISAICRPAGVTVPDGWQGDLICYPSSAACYVFAADDFSEHAIQTPLMAMTNYGVYSNAGTAPAALRTYQKGKDQYAWGEDASVREFRLQNYDAEWVLLLRFPLRYKLGQELTLTTETVGLSGIASGESKVFVEKAENGVLWLMDYENNLGYVCKIAEE